MRFSVYSLHIFKCSSSIVITIYFQTLSRMFPKDTLLWKLEMLKYAIASVNSHIYSVRAETLILLRSKNSEYIRFVKRY